MNVLEFSLIVWAGSLIAGFLGALTGLGGGVVLVLGSEGEGLRPRVAAACDELIALPILGKVESLGVSAAASAILYEILQNRARSS